MKRSIVWIGISVCGLIPLPSPVGAETLHHDITVTIDPGTHSLEAEDRLTLPRPVTTFEFSLHKNLSPSGKTAGLTIVKSADRLKPYGPFTHYRAMLPNPTRTFTIAYKGTIFHALDDEAGVPPSGVQGTGGQIGPEGVFLAGVSGWYPQFGDSLATFSMEVKLPEGWSSVSQGVRSIHKKDPEGSFSRWEEPNPQDEIYLIAAPFTEYPGNEKPSREMAFLRTPDADLARRYLEATEEYLELYSRMLGPYPYGKFALVENFWETGFGMPSFTLLGPRVIRLPFIIRSSYPHEILHNWWGNGVFLSPESGNWSEGLTSYLADHYFQEEAGEGASYRRNSLQKYTDYVSDGADFPLSKFRGRNNPATEAVGYGKTLMLFHMLRQDLGDAVFLKGLRIFYKNNLFKRASFDDVRLSFEKAAGLPLSLFFDQWTKRPGAPAIRIDSTQIEPRGKKFRLTVKLQQTQTGPAFQIRIPAVVTLKGREQAVTSVFAMSQKIENFTLDFDSLPLRIDIDPEYDLFRRLDRTETPPGLTQMIAAEETVFVLPSKPDHPHGESYRKFAEELGRRLGSRVSIVSDSEIKSLPVDKAVWLLGWENRFSPGKGSRLTDRGFKVSEREFGLGSEKFSREEHALVLTLHRDDSPFTLAWIAAADPDSLPGLARKVPHYGPYGLLVFEGKEPGNVLKKRWPVLRSALSKPLNEGGLPPRGRIPAAQTFSASF